MISQILNVIYALSFAETTLMRRRRANNFFYIENFSPLRIRWFEVVQRMREQIFLLYHFSSFRIYVNSEEKKAMEIVVENFLFLLYSIS